MFSLFTWVSIEKRKVKMDKNQIMRKYFYINVVLIASFYYAGGASAASDKSSDSGGLPQLDISTWPTQLFWLIITFSVGYFLVSTFVIPSISTVIERRSNKLSSDLNNAKKAQEDAKNAFSLYQSSLEDARSQAANTLAKATEEAKLDTAKREAAISKKLAANSKKAEEKISKIREETLSSLNELATDISQKIITDLTPIKVQKSVVKKYVSAQSRLQN